MQSDLRQAVFQLVTAVGMYVASWAAAYQCLKISYWVALIATLPAAGFTVRLFIFSHDCGHGSFVASRRWNDRIGFLTGLFAYTPYLQWRTTHARHHARAQQIEERGVGYFWTMTVKEYRNAHWLTRLGYRAYRHPLVLFTLGGLWNFGVDYRFHDRSVSKEAQIQVHVQNAIYVVTFVGLGMWLGFWNVFLIQMPILFVSTTAGLWLFHVQHHYEEAYHADKSDWSFEDAALKGSSFLQLGPVAQYFAGNINFHHVHHLAPKIPNYRLKEAHLSEPTLSEVKPLSVSEAFSSHRFTLIDSERRCWTGFGQSPAAVGPDPTADAGEGLGALASTITHR